MTLPALQMAVDKALFMEEPCVLGAIFVSPLDFEDYVADIKVNGRYVDDVHVFNNVPLMVNPDIEQGTVMIHVKFAKFVPVELEV